MADIYLLKYNNYHNRTYKRELGTTIAPYLLAADGYKDFTGINFDKKDGISTSQTINFTALQGEFEPNYLIVCGDSSNTIVSRWFVMEAHWNRQRQLTLKLRRDVLVDYFDDYKAADFYCEKGYVSGTSDPLIYNSEGQSFNSILQKRTLLKSGSSANKRYIAAFIDKTWKGGKIYKGVGSYNSWDDFPLNKYKDTLVMSDAIYGIEYKAIAGDPADTSGAAYGMISFSTGTGQYTPLGTLQYGLRYGNNSLDATLAQTIATSIASSYAIANKAVFKSILSKDFGYLPYDELGDWANNDIFFVDGVEYRLSISVAGSNTLVRSGTTVPGFDDVFRAEDAGNWVYDVRTTYEPKAVAYGKVVSISWAPTGSTSNIVAIGSTRTHTGQPYDILYAEDCTEAREFFSYFASQYAGGNVLYDLQLVPYAPSGMTTWVTYATGKNAYWANADSRKGSLSHVAIKAYLTAEDTKVGANVDMCRIVSPDHGSYWDFNPAEIGGVGANSLKYEITFIPFGTYIHIFPTFGGIYGTVNETYTEPYAGESRGLVCTDDFSLAYSTSNWETYKLQNSAYSNAHERVMQNMSVTQRAERINEIVGGITGTISGSVTGAMAGGVGGAIVGGVGNAAAGAASFMGNEMLRKEEMSYAEDMYNYSLRNIQAQAQPLARSNSVAVGNSFFPYIEYYSCTTDEKTIFKDRLKKHGWSLGIVTTVNTMKTRAEGNNFTKFVKGRIINMNLGEDAHVCAEINSELQKGVFF